MKPPQISSKQDDLVLNQNKITQVTHITDTQTHSYTRLKMLWHTMIVTKNSVSSLETCVIVLDIVEKYNFLIGPNKYKIFPCMLIR